MLNKLNETSDTLKKMINNSTLSNSQRNSAKSTLEDVTKANLKWQQILNEYESVNDFADMNKLINPSNWYEELDEECSNLNWGDSMLCSYISKNDFEDHWSSFFPAKLLHNKEWKQIGRAQSELQSHHDLVCRLLLEKKKTEHSQIQIQKATTTTPLHSHNAIIIVLLSAKDRD